MTLLFRDLLVGVTSFFRDEEVFAALAATVVPKLLAGKGAGDTVEVWVAGCATGEEVYSIAILLREQLELQHAAPMVQIYGTDIDERALARAGRHGAGSSPRTRAGSCCPRRCARCASSPCTASSAIRPSRASI